MKPSETSSRHVASDSGFTLIELLVAMTLLGILMTALFGGLRLGTRVWEASERVLEDEGKAMAIRKFLHDRFEQALPIADNRHAAVFKGGPSTLRFVSTMPESVGFGPYVIELILAPAPGNADSADLKLRWRLAMNASTDTDAISERVLLGDLGRAEFAYFGNKAGKDGKSAWHREWAEAERLPELIRLDLEFAAGGDRHWPILVVAPRIDEWYETDN